MRFKNGSNKVVTELRVVQFWSEIILVISVEIRRIISDEIALHSVQLPLFIFKLAIGCSNSEKSVKTRRKQQTSCILT